MARDTISPPGDIFQAMSKSKPFRGKLRRSRGLIVRVLPATDAQYKDQNLPLRNLVNDTIISPPVPPIPLELPLERIAQFLGVRGKIRFDPGKDLFSRRSIEFPEILLDLIQVSDFIHQAVSLIPRP